MNERREGDWAVSKRKTIPPFSLGNPENVMFNITVEFKEGMVVDSIDGSNKSGDKVYSVNKLSIFFLQQFYSKFYSQLWYHYWYREKKTRPETCETKCPVNDESKQQKRK